MEFISVMTKTGKMLSFNYFDSNEYVYKEACTICDPSTAITVLKYFEQRKKIIFNNAYLEYLKKAKNDFNLAIVDTLLSKNTKIFLTIFDNENEIYYKYSKMLGRNLTDEEKVMVYNKFKQNVELCINNSIFEKGKIK